MIPTLSLDTSCIEFEDVNLRRATALNPSVPVNLLIIIHNIGGKFTIYENETVVVEGIVRHVKNAKPISDLKKYYVESNSPTLNQNDFYKELRLRGYKYTDLFRSVQEYRTDGTYSRVKWTEDKWPAFMDCLLQTLIMQTDSRQLLLPTRIRKIRINPSDHFEKLKALDADNPVFQVYSSKSLNTVVGGGIEISGVEVTSVTRHRSIGTDVLETYQFVPLNCLDKIYTVTNAARIFIQLALEKTCTKNVKFVEVLHDDQTPNIGFFQEAFSKTMVIQPELVVLSKNKFDKFESIAFQNMPLLSHADCTFILAADCIRSSVFLSDVEKSLGKTGFLILFESIVERWEDIQVPQGFQLTSGIQTENGTLLLLERKAVAAKHKELAMIHINSDDTKFDWLEAVKRDIKARDLLIFEQNKVSGIVGLTNCLRLEPGFKTIRCVLAIDSKKFDFSGKNSKLISQLALNLPVNVYKNGKWGTYRHLTLDQEQREIQSSDHLFLRIQRLGDLSTLAWVTGPLTTANPEDIVNIQYTTINFRDLMIATGRIPAEYLFKGRLDSDAFLGSEFAGVMKNGTRVMGLVMAGMATKININSAILYWRVPDHMSIREAATIPTVYVTIYFAFFVDRKISKGDTILIHSGAGGVGLAAIHIALTYGLTVFTTVSSEKKKKYLLEMFPALQGMLKFGVSNTNTGRPVTRCIS